MSVIVILLFEGNKKSFVYKSYLFDNVFKKCYFIIKGKNLPFLW